MTGDRWSDRLLLWVAGRVPGVAPGLRRRVDDRRMARSVRRWDEVSEALRRARGGR